MPKKAYRKYKKTYKRNRSKLNRILNKKGVIIETHKKAKGVIKDEKSVMFRNISRYQILPSRLITKMNTEVQIMLPTATNYYAFAYIKLNGMEAPFADFTSNQWAVGQTYSPNALPNYPDGYKFWLRPPAATGYGIYKVHASKLKMIFQTKSLLDQGTAFMAPISSSQPIITTPTLAQVEAAMRLPGVKTWDFSSNNITKANGRSSYCECAPLEAVTKPEYNAEAGYSGGYTITPSLINYWLVGYKLQSAAATSGLSSVRFYIDYYVELTNFHNIPADET